MVREQVRGAACIASGRAVRAFPTESAPFLDALFELWTANLDDNIFSVRQDAAAALSDFVASHGDLGWDRTFAVLR